MNYIITLTLVHFSRVLDELTAIQLASVSGLFATFKHRCESQPLEQVTPVFHVDQYFPWQTFDLFLSFFSGRGRAIDWDTDDLVEFVNISHYFMVHEQFLTHVFRAPLSDNFYPLYEENQLCAVMFTLKMRNYLSVARSLLVHASREYDGIFVFGDLLLADSIDHFRQLVNNRSTGL